MDQVNFYCAGATSSTYEEWRLDTPHRLIVVRIDSVRKDCNLVRVKKLVTLPDTGNEIDLIVNACDWASQILSVL